MQVRILRCQPQAVLCYAVKQLISKVSDAGFDSLVRHMTDMTHNCFKCDKKLESATPHSDKHDQPYAATTFIAYGQYGSTVFDPAHTTSGREFLQLNLCDECLVSGRHLVHHVRRIDRGPDYEYQPWDLGADYLDPETER